MARIITPANGSIITTSASPGVDTDVTFVGDGSDPEDGALAGSAFRWSVDGQIAGTGRTMTTRLAAPFCEGTLEHSVRLDVIDSDGHTATSEVRVRVRRDCVE